MTKFEFHHFNYFRHPYVIDVNLCKLFGYYKHVCSKINCPKYLFDAQISYSFGKFSKKTIIVLKCWYVWTFLKCLIGTLEEPKFVKSSLIKCFEQYNIYFDTTWFCILLMGQLVIKSQPYSNFSKGPNIINCQISQSK